MKILTKSEVKSLVESIPARQILFAATSDQDYDMSRTIILDTDKSYTGIKGSHCSCYGFDETEWDATEYTGEELGKALEGWTLDEEKVVATLMRKYLA